MILSEAPRLIWAGLVRRRVSLLVLALDLAVPPLVLLCLLITGMVTIGAAVFLVGYSPIALIISGLALTTLMTSVFLAWLKFGRDVLPPRVLLGLVGFSLAKFGLYRRILSRRSAPQWVRTERMDPLSESDASKSTGMHSRQPR